MRKKKKPLVDYPTTTDLRLYDADETEFLLTVRRYQEESGIKFVPLSHLFKIVLDLGYRKVVSTKPKG